METTVVIPDDLFNQAERLARRTKRSRSQVFTDALREYVVRHAPGEVTKAMDQVCDELEGPLDPFVSVASRRKLKQNQLVVSQGEVWWADLTEPTGLLPGLFT